MRIVLLGAPGSGKRTQTMLMVKRYGIPSIFTGELLKTALADGTPLGLQVKEAMQEGRSVTEEIVLELIRERLLQPDAQQGFVLDGFPRNILQAITLDELLFEMGLPIELALLVDIETDVLMERLVGRRTCKSCGTQYNIYVNPTAVEGVCDLCGGGLRHRADDNEETISNRLHVYDHLVSPLIKHYTRQNKLQRMDGSGEIAEVFARICQAIDSHVPPPVQQPASVSAVHPRMAGAVSETEYAFTPEEGLRPAPAAMGLGLEQTLEEVAEAPATQRKKTKKARKPATKKKAAGAKKAAKPKTVKSQTVGQKAALSKKTAASAKKSPVKQKATAKRRPSVKPPVGAKAGSPAQTTPPAKQPGVKKVSVKKAAPGKKLAAKRQALKQSKTSTAKQPVAKQVKKKVVAKKQAKKHKLKQRPAR